MTTNRRRLRRSLVLGAAFAALSTAFSATAATAQVRMIPVHMAAQPLGTALETLARQSGTDILFTPAAVAGLMAPAIDGTMAPDAAVERLIAGSRLTVRRERNGALLVSGSVVTATPRPVTAAADPQGANAEIVVTGYASSLTGALAQKRKATNVIEVVKAEDIGKFPAQNIAEALQRVPGVSIVRDRGEGVFVRIRGLGSGPIDLRGAI